MLRRKRSGRRRRRLFCLPQLKLLLMECQPFLEAVNQAALFRRGVDIYVQGIRGFRRGFVLGHHGLDAALRITSGAFQILLGVVHFVLVFLLMGRRQDELIVQRILLGSGGLGILRG